MKAFMNEIMSKDLGQIWDRNFLGRKHNENIYASGF
uniref:Uncharacterized protein n=1 Tax=Siphoviridae sp. ctzyE57 TaxID=2827982 RepID=A0A8S5SGG9_9CAUD|nr:MAG TPA: hypothetical protein [Siphoviridae sp. ctzyE57]